MEITVSKAERLLQIYSRLVDGETLHKDELAQQFHVTERSVQRDMESLRCFLPIRVFARMSYTIGSKKGIAWNARSIPPYPTEKSWQFAKFYWIAGRSERMRCCPFWIG